MTCACPVHYCVLWKCTIDFGSSMVVLVAEMVAKKTISSRDIHHPVFRHFNDGQKSRIIRRVKKLRKRCVSKTKISDHLIEMHLRWSSIKLNRHDEWYQCRVRSYLVFCPDSPSRLHTNDVSVVPVRGESCLSLVRWDNHHRISKSLVLYVTEAIENNPYSSYPIKLKEYPRIFLAAQR